MTQLNCSVTSCLYNQDHYCSKDDITVGGSNAKRTSDTCCESFRERNGSVCNSTGQASRYRRYRLRGDKLRTQLWV